METYEIANRLVELCKKSENLKAIEELYSNDVVSIEMKGAPNEKVSGKENILQKNREWFNNVETMHASEISNLTVIDSHFSCKMSMDCTFKNKERMTIEELAIYKVDQGKIVEEQFFYESPMS